MEYKPHPYQQYCYNRILNDPALGLFLDMGLGKTSITLTAINELKYNRFALTKVLVIAPKKVAEATWQKEAAKWNHLQHLRFSTVLGSKQKRIQALNTPADIYIINRENVVWLVEYYRNAWPFDMVVVDESSSFKNRDAKRFKALTWVRPHIKRILELTGTPSPNGLIDLWAQLYLLDCGKRLGKTVGAYRDRYFNPDKRDRTRIFSWALKPEAEKVIWNCIGDICISMKAEDYLTLPPLINDIIPVALDSKAAADYKKLEREMVLEINEDTVDAGTAAVLTNKLLQLCNGAVYSDNGVAEIHKCKIEAFMELIEGLNDQPALVFYNFRHDLIRIKAALSSTGLRVRELHTADDETAWNNHEVDILLAHPASAAYGLNLQDGGNHVIWFGLNWSLELYQQAVKRLHRQGQKQKVIVHHLVVENSVDEDVMAALEDKSGTQERLLQALNVRIQNIKRGE